MKGGSKQKELKYKDNEILCFIFISLNVKKLAMKFDLVQVNGEGDLRGQTSANPSQQQSQTNGGNRTSETSANQAHSVPRGIQSARNMSESNAQVSNPSSSSTRASTMKTNTKSYAKKNNVWKP